MFCHCLHRTGWQSIIIQYSIKTVRRRSSITYYDFAEKSLHIHHCQKKTDFSYTVILLQIGSHAYFIFLLQCIIQTFFHVDAMR